MEAAVQGLVAVILNGYEGAMECRGARGTAGSGRDARTLVEGLSLSITHNHWLAVNHVDLHACLPLQEPDDGVGHQQEACGNLKANRGGSRERGFEARPLDASKVGIVPHSVALIHFIARHVLCLPSGVLTNKIAVTNR